MKELKAKQRTEGELPSVIGQRLREIGDRIEEDSMVHQDVFPSKIIFRKLAHVIGSTIGGHQVYFLVLMLAAVGFMFCSKMNAAPAASPFSGRRQQITW